MAKKLYIKTHGCQMNEYDSSRMADLLRTGETVEMTDTPENADILLLNTCSIREKAQEKVFHQLGRWKASRTATRISLSASAAVSPVRKPGHH